MGWQPVGGTHEWDGNTYRRRRVERDELGERDGGVEVVDGHRAERAESPVDAPDERVQPALQLLMQSDVEARGHGDLYEDDLVNPLGVLLEHPLEGEQLVRDALQHTHIGGDS